MTTIIPSKQIASLRSLLLTALLSAGFAAAFIAADRHSATKLQQAGSGSSGAGTSGAGVDAGTSASGVSGTLDWQSLDLERFSAPASSGAMRASQKAQGPELQTPAIWN